MVEIVDQHLESGMNCLEVVDEDGYTALHHAARYNRVKTLEALLQSGASKDDVITSRDDI